MFKSFWFYFMNIGCIRLWLLKCQLVIEEIVITPKQFDWTYDLNCDLYNCYTKAKENLAIGYMKRMKQNWDTIYVIKLVEL